MPIGHEDVKRQGSPKAIGEMKNILPYLGYKFHLTYLLIVIGLIASKILAHTSPMKLIQN